MTTAYAPLRQMHVTPQPEVPLSLTYDARQHAARLKEAAAHRLLREYRPLSRWSRLIVWSPSQFTLRLCGAVLK
ncbi:hypothetical protein [Deinococcus hopiensis]|uniref:Uncharacterized protein n=1 Tax=Deinococcus hopiensis KR-140 TaxID=695939 RepID=A0A1W1VW80_9DEIO|nr:hypothetical protein [Deinococcus hopiensis]SMB97134.1 hypothetical protein SAMN00790413_06362 [Deinococcus hopiensis KR-140]